MPSYKVIKTVAAGTQLVLGLLLFVAPWVVGFAVDQTAAWTAWATGVLIALVGAVALAGQAYAAAWVNLVLGLWAIVAPWLLGFAMLQSAMWSHVALGALVALAAAAKLWAEHQSSRQVHA